MVVWMISLGIYVGLTIVLTVLMVRMALSEREATLVVISVGLLVFFFWPIVFPGAYITFKRDEKKKNEKNKRVYLSKCIHFKRKLKKKVNRL